MTRSRTVAARIAVSAAALACLWYFAVPEEPAWRVCGFHWLTGRECPLCGMTRALFALAQGRWSEAVHFNAMSPVGFAMLFWLPWPGPPRNRVWRAGLAAFAVYGVVRMFNS